jgi:hypothetical protein
MGRVLARLLLCMALALPAGCGTVIVPDTSGPRYGESKSSSA